MATLIVKLAISLPDDTSANFVRLYKSDTLTGSYTLDQSLVYTYGLETIDAVTIDSVKYYKIAFYNSSTLVEGNLSDAVLGSVWQTGKPSVRLTSLYDGNPLSTSTDVYNESGLTTSDFTEVRVNSAIKASKARIDLLLGETAYEKYGINNESNVSRRKYNAELEVLKQAEVSFALASIYQDMAAETIVENKTAGTSESRVVSIGSATISSEDNPGGINVAKYLENKSEIYMKKGQDLLRTIAPPSVDLSYSGLGTSKSKFINPTTQY